MRLSKYRVPLWTAILRTNATLAYYCYCVGSTHMCWKCIVHVYQMESFWCDAKVVAACKNGVLFGVETRCSLEVCEGPRTRTWAASVSSSRNVRSPVQ